MAPKKRDAPESAPDPETGETVHIGTEEELHWFDEADDDDDAETEELLKQLSEPAKDVGDPWWLPSGKPDREKRKLKQAIPLKGTADDPSFLTPRRQTHVERLMARRRAKALAKEHREAKQQRKAEAKVANSVVKILATWHNNILTSKDFSKAYLLEGLSAQFKSTVTAIDASPTEIDALLQDLRQSLIPDGYETGLTDDVPLPTEAPALYKDREDRRQKPDAFIRDTYPEWVALQKAFPRSVFADIDPPLYTAISRYGLSDELDRKFYKSVGKPQKSEDMTDAAVLERKRERDREASKRYRAKVKHAKM